MFLTQVHLNPARRATRTLLTSPQRLHTQVLFAFPPETSDQGRILWRLDRSEHRLTLYISSPVPTRAENLQEEFGWQAPGGEARCASTQPLLDRLEIGQRWGYRLRANPVISQRNPAGGRSRVLPHVTVAYQEAWLDKRAEQHGFALPRSPVDEERPDVIVSDRGSLRFSKGTEKRRVTLAVATYDGVLEVQDPERLRDALMNGIGKAKAYGCGLLTLAPVR